MVERLKREVAEYGSFLFAGVVALLNVILGLILYIYSHETSALGDRIDSIEIKLERFEQARDESSRRLQSVEDASAHINRDLDRIGKNIESLNDKLDRIIQQAMHTGARSTKSSILSIPRNVESVL